MELFCLYVTVSVDLSTVLILSSVVNALTKKKSTSLDAGKGCEENPCLNGGLCQESPGQPGYECQCQPNFVGQNCALRKSHVELKFLWLFFSFA